MYVNDNKITCFNGFGVEHIPEEIENFIVNKNVITNIFKVQVYNWIMFGYFCIGFIDFMLKANSLLEYTNSFSRNDYEKMRKQ